MKSLAEREAYRAKQKAAEAELRGDKKADKAEAKETESSFDAKEWLNDSVENVNGNLGELTDDELSSVEKGEASGKKRAAVVAAIKKEKEKRAASDSGWNPNNG